MIWEYEIYRSNPNDITKQWSFFRLMLIWMLIQIYLRTMVSLRIFYVCECLRSYHFPLLYHWSHPQMFNQSIFVWIYEKIFHRENFWMDLQHHPPKQKKLISVTVKEKFSKPFFSQKYFPRKLWVFCVWVNIVNCGNCSS